MKKRTDEDIMLEVTNGNIDALSILFERYNVIIYNFLYRMSADKTVSEDLTQEVFIKIIKARKNYTKVNFKAWIYTIARNLYISYYRKNSKLKKITTNNISIGCTDENNLNKEDFELLNTALQKLNESDRELIIMHKFQKIRYNEIAEIKESTEGAIKTKVHRALNKLKKIYFQNL